MIRTVPEPQTVKLLIVGGIAAASPLLGGTAAGASAAGAGLCSLVFIVHQAYLASPATLDSLFDARNEANDSAFAALEEAWDCCGVNNSSDYTNWELWGFDKAPCPASSPGCSAILEGKTARLKIATMVIASWAAVTMVVFLAIRKRLLKTIDPAADLELNCIPSKESDISSEHEQALPEKRDQIALVQEQLDDMRIEHSTMLANKTRLASKLEFVDEKYKIMENSFNSFKTEEFKRKERTNKKIDLLESELSEARRKIQSTELRYKTAEAIQNTQHREIKTNLEKERKMHEECQEMLDTLQVQHNTLLSEAAELKSQVETLQYNASLSQHGAAEGYAMPNNDKNVDELQHKLVEMTAREESLKSQVGLAKQHAQHYKRISEAHELALKELSQSEQSVTTASEELISQNSEEICTLTEKLTKANDERQRLQAELEEYQTRGSNEIRELNGALTKTQHQLEECRQKEESAIALEQEIRVQFSKLDVRYEESQNSLSEQRERCVSLEDKIIKLKKIFLGINV